MTKSFFLGTLTAAALAVLAQPIAPDAVAGSTYPVVIGEAGVTDGDTLRMARAKITDGGKTRELAGIRIRLYGIDAPEKEQICRDGNNNEWRCGNDATKALTDLVRGKEVTCEVRDIDRYERLVSVCSVSGIPDLNAELVRRGLALAYRQFSRDYVDEQEAARAARAGLWAGIFDMPWEWRKGHH